MSLVKNRLKINGSIKDLLRFIEDNYEKDIYHPSDGVYPSNLLLFFGKSFPTPSDILDDKDKIYRWRMNNWGTPFLIDNEDYKNELTVLYKHDFDYTPYKLSTDNNKFNPYTLIKLEDYSEMFYGENIHPDENELISDFYTTMTPPSKLITNWVNIYKYSSLVFRLDYWDIEDRFVGNIHYDYSGEKYILEHYVKDHNVTAYVKYMLEEELKTIEDYASELTELIILTNPEKSQDDYDEIEKIMLDELEMKCNLNEQINFISMLIRYLNGKRCNS